MAFSTTTLVRSAAIILVLATSAFAAVPSPPIGKLNRIGDAALARSQKAVASADAAIDKAAAKGKTEKAVAAADRARAQLASIASKAHASLDKMHGSLEAKFATAENAGTIMFALDFTARRVEVRIDQHLTECLADLDQALSDAGIEP